MQEALNQLERNKVWELVPLIFPLLEPNEFLEIKLMKMGISLEIKLDSQGYCQEGSIDYEETFAPVTRWEAIRMLLTCTSYKKFILYQMDVKSAFLNGYIMEDV